MCVRVCACELRFSEASLVLHGLLDCKLLFCVYFLKLFFFYYTVVIVELFLRTS